MPRSPIEFDALVIQSPCTVPWESMTGDAAKRWCGQCRLHVRDVSQMTRAEVAELVRAPEGRGCLRIWRRPDGRVITKDCQRVVRALRRRWQAVTAAAAGLLALVGLGGCRGSARSAPCDPGCAGGPTIDGVRPLEGARPTMGSPAALPPPPAPPPVPGATVTTGK